MTRTILSGLIFAALLAGCSAAPAASATAGATPSPPDIPSASAGATAATRALTIGPFSMQVPTGWRTRQGLPNPSGNWALAWLSPETLAGECATTGQGGVCHPWPISTSVPGGIVVAVRQYGLPGSKPPADGDEITVGGLGARRLSGPADDACRAIGGSELTRVVMPVVPGAQGWFAIDACVGPEDPAASEAAFDALVASVTLAGNLPAPSG
jgi:hypothetical protein